MFLQVSVCPRGVSDPDADTPDADTPGQTHPQADTPNGQTHTPRRPLQRTVRILLECSLVNEMGNEAMDSHEYLSFSII